MFVKLLELADLLFTDIVNQEWSALINWVASVSTLKLK